VIAHGLWLYSSHAAIASLTGISGKKIRVRTEVLCYAHGMLDPYFQKAESRKFKAIPKLALLEIFLRERWSMCGWSIVYWNQNLNWQEFHLSLSPQSRIER
jgi:hypothetical protein